jgi:hypothetical protein
VPVIRIFTIRPLAKIEEDLENLYYLNAIEKYFARPITYN